MNRQTRPDSPSPGRKLLDLVDGFLARHQDALDADRLADQAAALVVAETAGAMVLVRNGLALVPTRDRRGPSLEVRRYRDLDVESHCDYEARILAAAALRLDGSPVPPSDLADLVGFARIATDATEAESFKLVEALTRVGPGTEPPDDPADLAQLLGQVLRGLRHDARPIVDGPNFDDPDKPTVLPWTPAQVRQTMPGPERDG
jgi:hypothetical protein